MSVAHFHEVRVCDIVSLPPSDLFLVDHSHLKLCHDCIKILLVVSTKCARLHRIRKEIKNFSNFLNISSSSWVTLALTYINVYWPLYNHAKMLYQLRQARYPTLKAADIQRCQAEIEGSTAWARNADRMKPNLYATLSI